MNCRFCSKPISHSFLDFGSAPPSNAYLSAKKLHRAEVWYPLRVLVCDHCYLVQTEDFAGRETFFDPDYAYFSSFSSSWLEHCRQYVGDMTDRFKLGESSLVVEVASNDGYLLQHFRELGIKCFGVEPTASTARAAKEKGIDTVEAFFDCDLAESLQKQRGSADLMIANNVLAHVPDINGFAAGFERLLAAEGVATFEFPHLMKLIQLQQYDTVYHEHFSYLSLSVVEKIFTRAGLHVFDVEELATHGGSLRVFAQSARTGKFPGTSRLKKCLERERAEGMTDLSYYKNHQRKLESIKNNFLSFLLKAKNDGKRVFGYGAAAKGNTLLNFAGVRPDLLECVIDRNPAKQGKFMPGSRIPIRSEEALKEAQPDYVVLLPWNLEKELRVQLQYIGQWGGSLISFMPVLHSVDIASIKGVEL